MIANPFLEQKLLWREPIRDVGFIWITYCGTSSEESAQGHEELLGVYVM